MDLIFLYLRALVMAVTGVTRGSEKRAVAEGLEREHFRAGMWLDYAFARLPEPFCLNAERMWEISPLSMSIT